jgi:hypothetical protein
MKALLTILLFLTGSVLAQNTIGFSRTAKRYDRSQLGKISTMPTSIATNLLLWLEFSQNDGTNWYSLAAQANGTSPANNPTWTNLVGGAAYFNGTTNGILSTNAVLTGDFTVLAWFKPDGASSNARIVDKHYANGFWFGKDSSGARWGGGIKDTSPPYGHFAEVTESQWNMLTMMRSNTTKSLYLNATLVTNATVATGGDATAISIGQQSGSSSARYKGWIGRVLIIMRSLDAHEVTNLYNATKGDYGL